MSYTVLTHTKLCMLYSLLEDETLPCIFFFLVLENTFVLQCIASSKPYSLLPHPAPSHSNRPVHWHAKTSKKVSPTPIVTTIQTSKQKYFSALLLPHTWSGYEKLLFVWPLKTLSYHEITHF